MKLTIVPVLFFALLACQIRVQADTTGAMQVNIYPAAAITNGAQWALDDGGWLASGTTVSNLSPGTHSIFFESASGFITPDGQTITVVSGQTTNVTVTYADAPIGNVSVTIVPAGASANGAQWAVDGGVWQASGATVSGLSLGDHSIVYHDAAGFITPDSQTVTVAMGQTTNVTATYTPLGNLTVTIVPAGASANGAQWLVDSGSWQNSGATVSNLSLGDHTITFLNAANFVTPANQTVTVVSGQTTNVTVTYIPLGNLTVTLNPAAAITNGALWAVDNGLWQASGTTVSNLSTGDHTVIFHDTASFATPAGQTVAVVPGQTTNVTATYTPLENLTVTIVPAAAITNGAQWGLDNGGWLASGTTVPNLSLGSHSIFFESASGFITPTNQTITVVPGQSTNVTVTYGSIVLLENILAQPGNSFAFNCLVTAGLTFQVQFATNLAQTSWSDLGPSMSATNAMTPFVDTSATNGQRYYRIKILY